MTTFSQLVDEIVRECKRPDMLTEICSYANQTVREMHTHPETNGVCPFEDNRVELQLTANSPQAFTWTDPLPHLFQKIEAVRYDSVYDENGNPVYARPVSPGRNMNEIYHFYYRAADTIAFSGYGGANASISLSLFRFQPRLAYASEGNRAAEFSDTSGWTYAPEINTAELQAAARAETSNWILLRHHDICAEGLRAKTYKRTGDESRMRTAYSSYTQQRMQLVDGLFHPGSY